MMTWINAYYNACYVGPLTEEQSDAVKVILDQGAVHRSDWVTRQTERVHV
jgi:hypothetical protein